jgi:hypothetical protein
MTLDESRGRQTTVSVAWLGALTPILLAAVITLTGGEIPLRWWVARAVVPVLCSWPLVQGRRWARVVTVVSLLLGAVGAVSQLYAVRWVLPITLALVAVGVTHIWAAVALSFSPAVKAYFASRSRFQNLDLRGA